MNNHAGNRDSGIAAETLLEKLYWYYTENHSEYTPEIGKQYERLRHSLPELSDIEFDEIFSLIGELSVLQASLAFQNGVRVGFQLTMELLETAI